MSNLVNLLEGLVDIPSTPKKQETEAARVRRKYVAPWKPDALIVLTTETVCEHCANTTLSPNPFLLLREISPTGAIRETAKPNSRLDCITSLPIERQTIPAGTTPFCLECIEEEGLDLRRLFIAQQERKPEEQDNKQPVTKTHTDLTDLLKG
jgi:hypothetical protein